MWAVLKMVSESELCVKLKKYKFRVENVAFLGRVMSKEGVSTTSKG